MRLMPSSISSPRLGSGLDAESSIRAVALLQTYLAIGASRKSLPTATRGIECMTTGIVRLDGQPAPTVPLIVLTHTSCNRDPHQADPEVCAARRSLTALHRSPPRDLRA